MSAIHSDKMTWEEWDELAEAYKGEPDGFTDRSLVGMWFFFKGRLNRMRFFCRVVPVWIAAGAIQSLVASVGMYANVLYFVVLAAMFSLIVRRAHDMGFRPWLLLLMSCIPVLNAFTILYCIVMRGDRGPNRYGMPPAEWPGNTQIVNW